MKWGAGLSRQAEGLSADEQALAEVPLFKGALLLASPSPTPRPPACCSWLSAPCPHRPPFIQLQDRSYI